ncbi:MAG: hypothetical protein HXY20_04125 [Acidobacteria bacterium]|nr:hypothetical protein [Acidobacteriota bacterium]
MKKTILVAAVMFLGLTAAAFAQATYSVGSIPVTTVTASGYTEKTGDVTFTHVSGTSQAGTITISYGVPITVDIGDFVTIFAQGVYENAPPAGNPIAGLSINEGASSYANGQLVINVPAGVTGVGSFAISGVRVAVAGTALTSLAASISSTGNAITAGQTNVVVISSISAGLANIDSDPVSINGVAPGVGPYAAAVSVDEGYLAAFFHDDLTTTTSIMIKVTLDAAPTAGVTVTFPATFSYETQGEDTVTWETCASDGSGATLGAVSKTSSSTDLSVYYRMQPVPNVDPLVQVTDPTAIETLEISPINITISGSATLPLPAGTVSASVSLAPVGAAFGSGGAVLASPIPRYMQVDLGPVPIYTIIGSQTSLLIPFAVNAIGYNTGFSIANTTKDPGTTALGAANAAVPQSGVIKFWMYPQLPKGGSSVPTPLTYTTSGTSPGTGLDSTGKLPSGSTYTVLLSELLAAAGAPVDFQGYIIVVTNFTNAHCLYVLSDFAGFTQGAQALILTDNRQAAIEALDN